MIRVEVKGMAGLLVNRGSCRDITGDSNSAPAPNEVRAFVAIGHSTSGMSQPLLLSPSEAESGNSGTRTDCHRRAWVRYVAVWPDDEDAMISFELMLDDSSLDDANSAHVDLMIYLTDGKVEPVPVGLARLYLSTTMNGNADLPVYTYQGSEAAAKGKSQSLSTYAVDPTGDAILRVSISVVQKELNIEVNLSETSSIPSVSRATVEAQKTQFEGISDDLLTLEPSIERTLSELPEIDKRIKSATNVLVPSPRDTAKKSRNRLDQQQEQKATIKQNSRNERPVEQTESTAGSEATEKSEKSSLISLSRLVGLRFRSRLVHDLKSARSDIDGVTGPLKANESSSNIGMDPLISVADSVNFLSIKGVSSFHTDDDANNKQINSTVTIGGESESRYTSRDALMDLGITMTKPAQERKDESDYSKKFDVPRVEGVKVFRSNSDGKSLDDTSLKKNIPDSIQEIISCDQKTNKKHVTDPSQAQSSILRQHTGRLAHRHESGQCPPNRKGSKLQEHDVARNNSSKHLGISYSISRRGTDSFSHGNCSTMTDEVDDKSYVTKDQTDWTEDRTFLTEVNEPAFPDKAMQFLDTHMCGSLQDVVFGQDVSNDEWTNEEGTMATFESRYQGTYDETTIRSVEDSTLCNSDDGISMVDQPPEIFDTICSQSAFRRQGCSGSTQHTFLCGAQDFGKSGESFIGKKQKWKKKIQELLSEGNNEAQANNCTESNLGAARRGGVSESVDGYDSHEKSPISRIRDSNLSKSASVENGNASSGYKRESGIVATVHGSGNDELTFTDFSFTDTNSLSAVFHPPAVERRHLKSDRPWENLSANQEDLGLGVSWTESFSKSKVSQAEDSAGEGTESSPRSLLDLPFSTFYNNVGLKETFRKVVSCAQPDVTESYEVKAKIPTYFDTHRHSGCDDEMTEITNDMKEQMHDNKSNSIGQVARSFAGNLVSATNGTIRLLKGKPQNATNDRSQAKANAGLSYQSGTIRPGDDAQDAAWAKQMAESSAKRTYRLT